MPEEQTCRLTTRSRNSNKVHFLMEEVERYRSAAEDTLQQLDWCIGYFAGSKKECLGPRTQRE